jgi:hypothetical protein
MPQPEVPRAEPSKALAHYGAELEQARELEARQRERADLERWLTYRGRSHSFAA